MLSRFNCIIRKFQLDETYQIYSYRHPRIDTVWQEKIDYIAKSVGSKKVVIWGLKNKIDSLRYIYSGFYVMLKKLKIPVIWLNNVPHNNAEIMPGDFILASNRDGDQLLFRDDVRYCLHNKAFEGIQAENIVTLQVYTDSAGQTDAGNWNETTLFDETNRILYQPWGTNLLPWEFLPPDLFRAYDRLLGRFHLGQRRASGQSRCYG